MQIFASGTDNSYIYIGTHVERSDLKLCQIRKRVGSEVGSGQHCPGMKKFAKSVDRGQPPISASPIRLMELQRV